MNLATLGGGCFWCIEAIFQRLSGIEKVVSGYAGGITENPSYQEVCTGKTQHAEVIQLSFNPEKIEFEKILSIFWQIHDPTTYHQQGADIGSQYRSIIFYHDQTQKEIAEKVKLVAQQQWKNPIVTEILPFTGFYPAETYHQNFYKNNVNHGYCQVVITPKLKKFKEFFN